MQTIADLLDRAFRTAIIEAFGFDADPLIGVSQNEKFGDYQSNAAMGLAKRVTETTGQKTNPRAVAETIATKVRPALAGVAADVTLAGPGFINVRLDPAWLAARLQEVAADPRLGVEAAAEPETVVVDYSGPNVAKQMHVGHLRSTIIGDAISRVIAFQGHDVVRRNHVGDWGTQFGMLIAHLQSGVPTDDRLTGNDPSPDPQVAALADTRIGDLERFYRESKKRFDDDPAFADTARATVVALQAGDENALTFWRALVDETRRHYQPLYATLGVLLTTEDEQGESFYNALLPGVVAALRDKKFAVESQGATAVFIDGEKKPPVIVEKSGGGFLYATTDLAALKYRAETLHADRIIYTHDSRQALHFDQVFRIAKKAGFVPQAVRLEYAPFGTMLGEDNKPFKTRSGDTVKLKDLLEEAESRARRLVDEKSPDLPDVEREAVAKAVGIGAVKYSDLAKDRVSDYAFSWERAMAMDGNTAPYLQYAHARLRSILRKAGEAGRAFEAGASVTLESPYELALAKRVLQFGEVVELVGRELKPHYLCTYLYELSTQFSGFYEHCPVLKSEEPTRSSRLALCDVVAKTLAKGLSLLGIAHPDKM